MDEHNKVVEAGWSPPATLAKTPLPSENASLISQWTYSWIWPLLMRTYHQGRLTLDDLYQTPTWMATTTNTLKFKGLWQMHSPTMATPKWRMKGWFWMGVLFGGWWLAWSGCLTLGSDLLGYASSHSMRFFVDGLRRRQAFLEDPQWWMRSQLYWRGALLLVISLIKKLLLNQSLLIITTIAYLMRGAVMGAAFDRLLRMRRVWMVGAALNRLAVDTNRVTVLLMFGHLIWSSPLRILLSFSTVYGIMGYPALLGIGFILLVISSLFWLARLMRQVRSRLAGLSDERLQLTNEALSAITTLKATSQEHHWESLIDGIRQRELGGIRHLNLLFACSASLNFWSPVFAVTVSVVGAVWLGYALDAGIVFSSARAFQMLMVPMWMLPTLVNRITAASVSTRRLTELLTSDVIDSESESEDDEDDDDGIKIKGSRNSKSDNEDEPGATANIQGDYHRDTQAQTHSAPTQNTPHTQNTQKTVMVAPVMSVTMHNVTLSIDDKIILRNVSFALMTPSVVGVVGPMASGKSLLLSCLAGIIEPHQGQLTRQGSIGYCPSTGWIRQGTLRDNILLDRPYDALHYAHILRVCRLDDRREFPTDQMMLGEGGCTISGGQRQRIALARAIYGLPSILILDAPFTSLDPLVATSVWEGLLTLLHSKCIIVIATDDDSVLRRCSQVLALRAGTVACESVTTYSTCMELDAEGVDSPITDSRDCIDSIDDEGVDPEPRLSMVSLPTSSSPPSPPKSPLSTDDGEDVAEHNTLKLSWRLVQLSGGVILYGILFASVFGTDYLKLERDKLLRAFMRRQPSPTVPTASISGDTRHFLLLFTLLGSAQGVLTALANVFAVYLCIRASRQVHRMTLHKMLHARLPALEGIPVGRQLNRLGRDLEYLDYTFPEKLISLFGSLSSVICIILGICQLAPWMLLTLLAPIAIIIGFQRLFSRNWQALLRLTSQAMAPISALFGETMVGISTIRAHNATTATYHRFTTRCDAYTMSSYLSVASRRWISLRCEMVASLYVGALILYCILSGRIDDSTAGMLLLYALGAAENMDYLIKHLAEIDHCLIAVERTVQFAESLPQELPVDHHKGHHLGESSIVGQQPASVHFDCVSFTYRDRDPHYINDCKDVVLSEVSFKVAPGESVLVSGRTGVGKSSLINALLRVTHGSIRINDQDVSEYPLDWLRGSLVMAALQGSHLLDSATLRLNLDPHQRHSDEELWQVLALVGIKDYITETLPLLLDERHFSGRLSSGQRQLIVVARCILGRPPLLLLDESTASVEESLEYGLHERILAHLRPHSTVITISHRVDTIRSLYTRHLTLVDGSCREL